MKRYVLQRIPLKKQAQNFKTKFILKEYQNLQKFVDDDEEHTKYLHSS
jgi:peptide methionine sulfoxide reductase MsrA